VDIVPFVPGIRIPSRISGQNYFCRFEGGQISLVIRHVIQTLSIGILLQSYLDMNFDFNGSS
jgi:hypothetical protein